MSNIAVKGCALKISSPDGTLTGNVDVAPFCFPSNDVYVNNNGVYFDKITALAKGLTLIPTVIPEGTTGKGTLVTDTIDIQGTGSNVLDSGNYKAVLEGDKGTKTCTFMFMTTTEPPSEVPLPYSVTVEIQRAGQTDVSAT